MKKLNRTKEKIRKQWRKRSGLYYERHKELIRKKNLKHYHEKKKLSSANEPFTKTI